VTTGMTNSLHGIEHETTSKIFISMDMLPYTLVVSGTTVTVFRVEQKMGEKRSPSQVQEPSVAPAPQVQH